MYGTNTHRWRISVRSEPSSCASEQRHCFIHEIRSLALSWCHVGDFAVNTTFTVRAESEKSENNKSKYALGFAAESRNPPEMS